MRRPAFKKNFTTRDARTRFKIQRGTSLTGRTPRRRTEFAKGIVFSGDTLEVKQEVTFPFPGATVARRELAAGMIDQVMNLTRAEDEIAWENPLACLQQGATRSGQFLMELIFQSRTCLFSGGRGPRVILKRWRNFLLGNFIATNGGAPGRELLRSKTALTTSDKFQSSAFALVEFYFPPE